MLGNSGKRGGIAFVSGLARLGGTVVELARVAVYQVLVPGQRLDKLVDVLLGPGALNSLNASGFRVLSRSVFIALINSAVIVVTRSLA